MSTVPILGYAVAEGIIGLFAIAFHPLFEVATSASYSSVLPKLGSPITIDLYKWTLSTLLILPQTVLDIPRVGCLNHRVNLGQRGSNFGVPSGEPAEVLLMPRVVTAELADTVFEGEKLGG